MAGTSSRSHRSQSRTGLNQTTISVPRPGLYNLLFYLQAILKPKIFEIFQAPWQQGVAPRGSWPFPSPPSPVHPFPQGSLHSPAVSTLAPPHIVQGLCFLGLSRRHQGLGDTCSSLARKSCCNHKPSRELRVFRSSCLHLAVGRAEPLNPLHPGALSPFRILVRSRANPTSPPIGGVLPLPAS